MSDMAAGVKRTAVSHLWQETSIFQQDQLFIFLYTVTLHSYFLQISFSPTRGPNNLLNTCIINDTHSLADEANMAD